MKSNNNNKEKMKNSENKLLQFPMVQFRSFFEDLHILTIGVPFREDGFQIECLLPRKRGFSGAMMANPRHPYIQRGYRLFVIREDNLSMDKMIHNYYYL